MYKLSLAWVTKISTEVDNHHMHRKPVIVQKKRERGNRNINIIFLPSTLEPSANHQPDDEYECGYSTSYHQLESEVLKPHLPSELPALSLKAVSLKKDINNTDAW